ncbi:MAG: hypothetical protein ACFFC5_01285 [Promethearchaeota archaeon]
MVWWPRFIRKPKLRLKRPMLKLPKAPSPTVWYVICIAVVLFIFAGGLYNIVNQPLPFGQDPNTGEPMIILRPPYGTLSDQFVLEGMIGGILAFVGFLGFVIIYESTKHVYNPSYALMLLIAGIAMVVLAYVGAEWMIVIKTTSAQ